MLVDLLVDRASHPERDLQTIVLNEALAAAPKLTPAQCRAIAIHAVFELSHRLKRPESLDAFYEDHVRGDILPLAESLPHMPDSYRHIEYVGAASVGVAGLSFFTAFAAAYQGFGSTGASRSRTSRTCSWKGSRESKHLSSRTSCEGFRPTAGSSCHRFRDPSRLQLGTMRVKDVEGFCAQPGWEDLLAAILNLYNLGAMENQPRSSARYCRACQS